MDRLPTLIENAASLRGIYELLAELPDAKAAPMVKQALAKFGKARQELMVEMARMWDG